MLSIRTINRNIYRKGSPATAWVSVTYISELNERLPDAIFGIDPREGKTRKLKQRLRASVARSDRDKLRLPVCRLFKSDNRTVVDIGVIIHDGHREPVDCCICFSD
jgi:hypothetical protein